MVCGHGQSGRRSPIAGRPASAHGTARTRDPQECRTCADYIGWWTMNAKLSVFAVIFSSPPIAEMCLKASRTSEPNRATSTHAERQPDAAKGIGAGNPAQS